MRLALPLLALAAVACSSAPESPPFAASGGSPTAGWKAISPAPARGYGTLQLRLTGTTLEASLSTTEDDTPEGTLSVFLRWEGEDREIRLGELPARDGATLVAPFTPPACAPPASARATVVVRAGDVLVGVSRKDRALFRAPWSAPFEIELPGCRGPSELTYLPPISLAADPRLPLALCASCGLDPLPEVRLASATAAIDTEGAVLLSFDPVFVPDGEVPAIAINGVPVDGGTWRVKLPSRDAVPLRRGDNDIVVSVGSRPPWTAKLELPAGTLGPRLEVLRPGQPFVLEAERAPWARQYDASLQPNVEPILKASHPFWSEELPIEGTFAGFDHQGRTGATVSSANVILSARGGRQRFDVVLTEAIVVPIAP